MDWFTLVVLSLTTYRATRLVTTDDFPPILWLRDRLVGDWREPTDRETEQGTGRWETAKDADGRPLIRHPRWRWAPGWLSDLLSCPWCASGWLSMGVVGLTDAFVSVPVPVLAWGAVWALSALLASQAWA